MLILPLLTKLKLRPVIGVILIPVLPQLNNSCLNCNSKVCNAVFSTTKHIFIETFSKFSCIRRLCGPSGGNHTVGTGIQKRREQSQGVVIWRNVVLSRCTRHENY